MSRPTSILTIVKGRESHLRNLMLGLSQQTVLPNELVIVYMQDAVYPDLPELPFPVRTTHVPGDELPLAKARNLAVATAQGERLIFLDVDCIPAADFVADYGKALDQSDAVIMGEIRYLPKHAADPGWTYARLQHAGVRHAWRAPVLQTFIEPCADCYCFWSLSFALSRATYEQHGGFDEDFVGYGGEDTDFGRRCSERGIPLLWCNGALAYHQYHPHHMPPVHHLESILRNNRIFTRKWGHGIMESWLRAFELMGLIEKNGDDHRILRQPNDDDLALTAQQSHQPYASDEAVLAMLEQRRS